jgi:hypothetical protein
LLVKDNKLLVKRKGKGGKEKKQRKIKGKENEKEKKKKEEGKKKRRKRKQREENNSRQNKKKDVRKWSYMSIDRNYLVNNYEATKQFHEMLGFFVLHHTDLRKHIRTKGKNNKIIK